ncbi:MAG: phosphate ABC transporter permease subunit PstC, partial [Chloroflexi bacterium]|nr:phosphate ABC transporter permease subunit PstC [Chloroflexota bacterium]
MTTEWNERAKHVAVPEDLRKRRRPREQVVQGLLFLCGIVSILTTVGIVVVLGRESWRFFGSAEVTLREFLGSARWQPAIGQFGIWPLVNATLMTTAFAMLVAIPIGLGVAIYLSEYASNRARNTLKPVMEVLAGIPTVVYGYF